MGQDGNANSQSPHSGDDYLEPSRASSTSDAADDERPTACPPDDQYEHFARLVTSGRLSASEERRALSAPGLPMMRPTDDDERNELAADVSAPMLGQQLSGPHAIPLELSDAGFRGQVSTLGEQEALPPTVRAPEPLWPQEASTPNALDSRTIARVRTGTPFSRANPVVRQGNRLAEPLVETAEAHIDAATEFGVNEEGGALALVGSRATAPSAGKPDDPIAVLRDRYAVGDFTGAHEIAGAILAEDPHHAEAKRFQANCRDILIQMYSARLGSASAVPRIVLPAAELQWLSLDHRSGFLLSCVDGSSTIDEILDVCGMSRLDALRILYTLLQQQVIDVTRGA